MGELILHIGTQKTGTTALQKFFYDNREALLRNGVDYVQFTPQLKAEFSKMRNGAFLKRYCLALLNQQEISSWVNDFEENRRRLFNTLNLENRVLLSDEDFSAIASSSFYGKPDPREYWRILSDVVERLGAKTITIIVYLRRQDEYVISHWKEAIKGGTINKTFQEYLSLVEKNHELDYKKMLDIICDSFGSSVRIIVRSYNKVNSSRNGIIHDFCEALQIPWGSDYKMPKTRINESLPFDMIEALRTCKYGMRVRNSYEERQVRKKLAHDLSRKHPDSKGTTVLSAREAKILVEQYQDGNRRIEEEYFDNKSLFSEEYNEGPIWHPNRFRIAIYRVAYICPKLSLKFFYVIRRIRREINKVIG